MFAKGILCLYFVDFLLRLNETIIQKYPEQASMNKFKSLKQLGLNIKYFNNKISIKNQSTWKNVKLHTLQLSNRYFLCFLSCIF